MGLVLPNGSKLVTTHRNYEFLRKEVEELSFFDNYKDLGGGGNWVSGAEKQQLIEGGIPFEITGVQEDDANIHGPRYVLFCNIPNFETGEPEERKMGLQKESVPTRDAMLAAMKEFLETEGNAPVKVKLTKPNRAQLLVPAE